MNKYWILKGIKIIVIMTLAVFLFAYLVMYLWNWLLPDIMGVTTITFIQAIGLLVLSRLLFGSFHKCGGHHKHGAWKHRMRNKYSRMSDEEKRRFREKFGSYCQSYHWPETEGDEKDDETEEDKQP